MANKSSEEQHRPRSSAKSVPLNQCNIIGLNDDCLLGILSQLSMKELTSVGLTCLRLQGIARCIFQQDPAHQELELDESMITDYGVELLVCYLQNFGDLIRKICFKPTYLLPWAPQEQQRAAEQNELI